MTEDEIAAVVYYLTKDLTSYLDVTVVLPTEVIEPKIIVRYRDDWKSILKAAIKEATPIVTVGKRCEELGLKYETRDKALVVKLRRNQKVTL